MLLTQIKPFARSRASGLLEKEVDLCFGATLRQPSEICSDLARHRLLLLDPELPFPDAWLDHREGIFHALVVHGMLPVAR